MTTTHQANAAPLAALEFTNRREVVLKALRDGIVIGSLPQGMVLVETRLAEQLQVSRGTVREALLELQQEQLVSNGPTGRTQVRTLDSKTVLDLFQVRASLESLAVQLIAASPEAEDKREQLRELLIPLGDDAGAVIVDRVDADMTFHRTLCELSGNEVLLNTWASIEGPVRMAIMHAGKDIALSNMTAHSHEPYIAALDPDCDDPGALIFATLVTTASDLLAATEHPQQDKK